MPVRGILWPGEIAKSMRPAAAALQRVRKVSFHALDQSFNRMRLNDMLEFIDDAAGQVRLGFLRQGVVIAAGELHVVVL